MSVTYLSDYNPDGTVLGQDASELIGFWGADPVVQQEAPTDAATCIAALQTIGIFAA